MRGKMLMRDLVRMRDRD